MVKIFTDEYKVGTQGIKTDGMYMDGRLNDNLEILMDAVRNDWDGLVVIDGAEGSGKSVLTQQLAKKCDPSINVKRICFTPEEFKKVVVKAKKYEAVILDEGFQSLSSKRSMSEINHSIVAMLTEIRQKNLFIFIVLPTFFDLVKYAALWRSRALIHVYAKRFERGYFSFYSYSKKKDLYVQGKKFYNYKCVQPDFRGKFTKFQPIDIEEYKKKKHNSLSRHIYDEPRTEKNIEHDLKSSIVKNIYNNPKFNFSQEQLGEMFGVTRRTINKYCKSLGNEGEEGS